MKKKLSDKEEAVNLETSITEAVLDAAVWDTYEKDGDLEQAAFHYTRADRFGDAARVFEASRDFRNAAELFTRAGQIEAASRVWLKAGEPLRAARLPMAGPRSS